jgi:hypothetical protein
MGGDGMTLTLTALFCLSETGGKMGTVVWEESQTTASPDL